MASSPILNLNFRSGDEDVDVVEYDSIQDMLVPFYLPATIAHLLRASVITVLPLHALHLGFTYDDVGIFGTIGGVGGVIVNIPSGAFIGQHGPRAGLLLCMTMFAVAAAVAIILPSDASPEGKPGWLCFIGFGAVSFVFSCADGLGIMARQTFMGATVGNAMRGQAGSTLGGSQRLGYTVGPLIGGWLAHAFGPRGTYGLQVVMALVNCGIIVRLMPWIHSSQDISQASPSGSPRKVSFVSAASPSLSEVLSEHWKVLATVGVFSVAISYLRGARQLLFSLEGNAQQLTQAEVGEVAAISYFIDMLLFPVAGRMLDSLGRTKTGAISCTVQVLAFFLMLLLRSGEPRVAMGTFAIVSGVGNGLAAGILLTLGADLAPAHCRSGFLSLFRTITRIADVAAPAAVGILAETVSLPAAEVVSCVIGLGGALWVLFCVKETRVPDTEPDTPRPTLALGTAAPRTDAVAQPDHSIELSPVAAEKKQRSETSQDVEEGPQEGSSKP